MHEWDDLSFGKMRSTLGGENRSHSHSIGQLGTN